MERRKRRKKKKKKRRRRRRKRRQMTPYICRICCEILKKYLKQRFFSIISWKEESKRKNEGKCFSFLCICFVFFSFSFIFILFFGVSREEEHPKIGGFSVSCDLFLWVFLCGGGEKRGGGGSFFSIYFLSIFDLFSEKRCIWIEIISSSEREKKKQIEKFCKSFLIGPASQPPSTRGNSRKRSMFPESVAVLGIGCSFRNRLFFLETVAVPGNKDETTHRIVFKRHWSRDVFFFFFFDVVILKVAIWLTMAVGLVFFMWHPRVMTVVLVLLLLFQLQLLPLLIPLLLLLLLWPRCLEQHLNVSWSDTWNGRKEEEEEEGNNNNLKEKRNEMPSNEAQTVSLLTIPCVYDVQSDFGAAQGDRGRGGRWDRCETHE